MRRGFARPSSGDHMEDNLIPMINIIFLLLIFFMIAGHISRQAKPSGMEMATAESPLRVKPSNMKLSITKNGDYFIDDKKTNLAEIKAFIVDNKDVTEVNVQADKQVTSGHLDELLDLLRALNVNNVALTVVKKNS
ncbi:MAG: ExbD/TolR family protein [Methylophilaceae bacterium]